jgi:putative peptidoglycan binding protein
MQREPETQRTRRPKGFWTPVLVFTALVGIFTVFGFGDFLSDQQWESEYRDRLAVAAMRSPGDALNMAEEGVEQGRLDFPVYRELLASALSREDGDARGMALKSMASVLAYGGAFSNDLRKWFQSKPPQVFIYVRKDIDESVARTLEEELKQHGMDVVGRGAYEPNNITKTVVFCYEETVCNQSAQFVVNLLLGRGYEAEGPRNDKGHDVPVPTDAAFSTQGAVSAQGNEAMMLLNNSRIDVVLAGAKNTQLVSAGFDVKSLQQALNTLGHTSLKVDGNLGKRTRAALKAFQTSAGLPADGVLTVATRDAILKALSNSQLTASLL